MTYSRRYIGQIVMLALSIIGIGISIYLTFVHYDSENVPLICSSTGLINCERVLSSPYSVIPGTTFPITLLGMFWFVVSAVMAFGAWKIWPGRQLITVGQVVLGGVGLLTVLYLVYVELVDLHNICAWCTSLHVIILILLLMSVFQLLQNDADNYEDDGEDEDILEVSTQAR
jgi:uncharacterized membrane protein